VRHVRRGGEYLRVADRSWREPLSGEHARIRGGRWNSPGAFGVVYLNASIEVARAQVRHRLERRGIRPEDILVDEGPVLVHTTVSEGDYVNAITDAGLRALRLPVTYPLDPQGRVIPHSACQPIGQRAWDARERAIACRSAAASAPASGQELAYFGRRGLRVRETQLFTDWYS
jgi:hypothetical protein